MISFKCDKDPLLKKYKHTILDWSVIEHMVQFLQLFKQAIKLVSNSSYHKFAVAMLTYRWLVERIDLVSPIPCFYLWSVSWF